MIFSSPDIDKPIASQSFKQQRFSRFVADPAFPCVAAKSALHKDRMAFAEFASYADDSVAASLCDRLRCFSKAYPAPGALPVSLVAMFGDGPQNEAMFEAGMWKLLQAMHDHDRMEFAWDTTVGSDPMQNDFSFSIGGRAFFVVGLHPGASRLSRRAPFPCLVFNFHDQFESLKESGKFKSMQAVIRDRDLQLQGSANPVLARFGDASEARQYSGRAVGTHWRCPFRAVETEHA